MEGSAEGWFLRERAGRERAAQCASADGQLWRLLPLIMANESF